MERGGVFAAYCQAEATVAYPNNTAAVHIGQKSGHKVRCCAVLRKQILSVACLWSRGG